MKTIRLLAILCVLATVGCIEQYYFLNPLYKSARYEGKTLYFAPFSPVAVRVDNGDDVYEDFKDYMGPDGTDRTRSPAAILSEHIYRRFRPKLREKVSGLITLAGTGVPHDVYADDYNGFLYTKRTLGKDSIAVEFSYPGETLLARDTIDPDYLLYISRLSISRNTEIRSYWGRRGPSSGDSPVCVAMAGAGSDAAVLAYTPVYVPRPAPVHTPSFHTGTSQNLTTVLCYIVRDCKQDKTVCCGLLTVKSGIPFGVITRSTWDQHFDKVFSKLWSRLPFSPDS